jgi:hypothetical protein
MKNEDKIELSEETKRDILEYRKNYKKWIKDGKFKTLEQVKKELGLNKARKIKQAKLRKIKNH